MLQLHPGELAALVLSGPVIGTLKGITALLGMEVIPSDPIPQRPLQDEEVGRAELAIDADKVTGPVLWLHGEEDQLVPMAGSRRIACCATPT